MKIINLIILISFLFTGTVYPIDATSCTLRASLMANNAEELQRIKDAQAEEILKNTKEPEVGHVEPIAAAYNAAKKRQYNKSYNLLMEGLLGEDYVVNVDTAIGVIKALIAHYDVNTSEGKKLSSILPIIAKYKRATNHAKMKNELRQIINSENIAEVQKGKIYRPAWTFKGWRFAKRAIKLKFKTTRERKEALRFVRAFAIKLYENRIDPYYALKYAIPNLAPIAKTPQELESTSNKLFNLYIKLIDSYDRSDMAKPHEILQSVAIRIGKVAKNIQEVNLFIDFSIKSIENKIEVDRLDEILSYLFELIPIAKTPEDLKEICDKFLDLQIEKVKNIPKDYSSTMALWASESAFSFSKAEVKAAKNMELLRIFIDLATKLFKNKINHRKVMNDAYSITTMKPSGTLLSASAISAIVKDPKDLKDVCNKLLDLRIRLDKANLRAMEICNTLELIPELAKATKDIEMLKLIISFTTKLAEYNNTPSDILRDILELVKEGRLTESLKLYMNFGLTLANHGINPNILGDPITAISMAKGPKELREIYDIQLLVLTVKSNKLNPKEALSIFQKIGRIEKKVEKLEICRDFIIKYVEKGISHYAIEDISSAATITENPRDLREICDKFLDLRIKRFKSYGRYAQPLGFENINKIVNITSDFRELKEICDRLSDLYITLDESKIKRKFKPIGHYLDEELDLEQDLYPSIPDVVKKQYIKLYIDLAIKLLENKIDPYYTLLHMTEVAKNKEELMLFMHLAVELAKEKIDPSDYIFSKTSKNIHDLENQLSEIFDSAIKQRKSI